MDHVVEQL